MKKPRVIVCQHGARHRYAIPRMLEEAGMLAALYTNSCVHSPLGKTASMLGPFAPRRLRRLSKRRPEGIAKEKIFVSDAPLLSDVWTSLFVSHESWLDGHLRRHRALSRRMIQWGLQDADIIYAMYRENQDFLWYAREAGKKIIVDVFEHPQTRRLLAAECSLFGSCPVSLPDISCIAKAEMYFGMSAELADVLLCPSEWVADGVAQLCPQHTHKIKVCPYGSSIDYNGQTSDPVEGRIFWAGGDWLLKGLLDYAEAADILAAKNPSFDFRVAGITDPHLRKWQRCKNLHFLGNLSSRQMRDEFLKADVFVLPTRSEGLVGVVLEALSAGCPVITTKRAGIDTTDSDGVLIIPPGDVQALAAAIEKICREREFRHIMAVKARVLAAQYTLNAWKERLIKVLCEM